MLWNSANIYDEDGKNVMATIAQGQDITERKEAESQVIFQASLLDQVRNAVIATDLDGRIVYWNHFSEMLYRWKADEVLGRSIAETIVPEEKSGLIREVIEEIMRCGYLESELVVQQKGWKPISGLLCLQYAQGSERTQYGICERIHRPHREEEGGA